MCCQVGEQIRPAFSSSARFARTATDPHDDPVPTLTTRQIATGVVSVSTPKCLQSNAKLRVWKRTEQFVVRDPSAG